MEASGSPQGGYSLEEVERVINSLYSNTANVAEANAWLVNFLNSEVSVSELCLAPRVMASYPLSNVCDGGETLSEWDTTFLERIVCMLRTETTQ